MATQGQDTDQEPNQTRTKTHPTCHSRPLDFWSKGVAPRRASQLLCLTDANTETQRREGTCSGSQMGPDSQWSDSESPLWHLMWVVPGRCHLGVLCGWTGRVGRSFLGPFLEINGAMDTDGSFQKGSCCEILMFGVLGISLWVASAWIS